MTHIVLMDDREPPIMQNLLEKAGFAVEVRRIETSDYIVDDKIALTCKSYPDFVASVYNSHLHNEIYGMLSFPNKYIIALLLWRPDEFDEEDDVSFMTKMNKMADMINAEYIPIFRLKNRQGMVDVMKHLAEKYDDVEFPIQFRRRVEMAGSVNMDPILRIYMNLPGVGVVTAEAMHKKYPTMMALINAIKATYVYDKAKYGSKKDWRTKVWYADVPHMGEIKAKPIEDLLVGNEAKTVIQTSLDKIDCVDIEVDKK